MYVYGDSYAYCKIFCLLKATTLALYGIVLRLLDEGPVVPRCCTHLRPANDRLISRDSLKIRHSLTTAGTESPHVCSRPR